MDFLTSHEMHGSPHPTYSCVAIWRVLKLKDRYIDSWGSKHAQTVSRTRLVLYSKIVCVVTHAEALFVKTFFLQATYTV